MASACHLYALDEDTFEGDAAGFVALRFGDDMRESELVTKGSELESHRRQGLVASFFGMH